MAHEAAQESDTHELASQHDMHAPASPADQKTVLGLSFAAGTGLLLIFITLGVAVVAPPADSTIVGLLVLAGLLIFGAAVAAWFFAVQPHHHFDDINMPLPPEDHH